MNCGYIKQILSRFMVGFPKANMIRGGRYFAPVSTKEIGNLYGEYVFDVMQVINGFINWLHIVELREHYLFYALYLSLPAVLCSDRHGLILIGLLSAHLPHVICPHRLFNTNKLHRIPLIQERECLPSMSKVNQGMVGPKHKGPHLYNQTKDDFNYSNGQFNCSILVCEQN